MSDQLDAFLTSGTQPPAPTDAPAPTAAPEAPTGAPEAKPPATTAKAPERPQEAAPAAPEPDPDADIPLDGSAISPAAWQKARTDWKSKVVAAETEARLLREQIEAIRKQPPAQAQPQQAPPPQQFEPLDPVRDPVAYHNRLVQVQLNERLNMSELVEREKHTPEAFEAAVTEFQAAAQTDPQLFAKLHAQRHPYGWLFKEVERIRVQKELGDDPAAYKARLIAEERAKWEAEMAGAGHAPISPAAGLPPSLATTRSAAPRSTNGFSGPPPLDDIFRRDAKRR